jgi:nucleoid-associated protein YgaU
MTTDKRSRYAKTPRVSWTRADGSAVELIAPTPRPDRPAVFRRVATDTDRLDTLAARYYRDPGRLWRIADAAEALDPFDAVVPGQPVEIPPDK